MILATKALPEELALMDPVVNPVNPEKKENLDKMVILARLERKVSPQIRSTIGRR